MKFLSLQDLYVWQLRDLYDAERQIAGAFPQLAQVASSPKLQQVFHDHLIQTGYHIHRLEEIFQRLGTDPHGQECTAMKGILKEGKDLVKHNAEAEVRDAGLIGAVQKVEHYEMAGYGAVRSYARRLGYSYAADILQQTLDEEGQADEVLTRLAENGINRDAIA